MRSVSRTVGTGSARSLVPVLAGLVIVVGLVVPDTDRMLVSIPAAVADLVQFDWPRWVHNVADVVQIVTALFAALVWSRARRGQH